MNRLAVLNSFLVSIIFAKLFSVVSYTAEYFSAPPLVGDPSGHWKYNVLDIFLAYLADPIGIFLASLIGCVVLRFLSKRSMRLNWFIFAAIAIIVCLPFRIEERQDSIELAPARHDKTEFGMERLD